jgi:prepilin-type N-terminal cleavage/methylation domain-containing protein
MTPRRGFTLIEIVIVAAIVAILAALLQPVYSRAKYSAQVQSSVTRLRQLQVAVQLYRSEQDLHGFSVDQFPPYAHVYTSYLSFGEDFFRSPCGYKDGIESNLKRLSYQYTPFNDKVSELHLTRYEENALLFRDPHCNTLEQWENAYMSRRKLGVLVGGRIVNEIDTGSTTPLEWWLPKALRTQGP